MGKGKQARNLFRTGRFDDGGRFPLIKPAPLAKIRRHLERVGDDMGRAHNLF
jgi:hypothetical protein